MYLSKGIKVAIYHRHISKFIVTSQIRLSSSISKSSLPKMSVSPEQLVEQSKKLAAYAAVDENMDSSYKFIGIGSGSTVVYVAERIGQLPNKKQFTCIPTGFQSKQLIIDNGLNLGALEEISQLDIAFDGADEIDTSLNCIKGGGACLLQEKLVADSSKKFIVVADYRKKSPKNLGHSWKKGVPIEVVPNAYNKILRELTLLGGKAKVRDAGSAKAGPVVTDNGNFIIDCDFDEIEVDQVESLNSKIKAMIGVVETGLFVNMCEKAYIGEANGEISTLTK